MQQSLTGKSVLICCTEPVLQEALRLACDEQAAQTRCANVPESEHQNDVLIVVSETHAVELEGLPENIDGPCESMAQRGFGRMIHVVYGQPTGADEQVLHAHHRLACLRSAVSSVARQRAANGVTVNLVEVALVAGVNDADPGSAAVLRKMPLARAVTATEVAAAVLFLAAPAASYITGVCLPVTGGHGLGLFPEQLR